MSKILNKKYAVCIAMAFILIIYVFAVLHIFLPDRVFSEQENRNLTQRVTASFKTVFSGEFMDDIDDYFVDQFPLRDKWIALKALADKLVGKQDINGIYFGVDNRTLLAQYEAPSTEDLEQRINYVNQLGENLEIPVYMSLIPDKTYVLSDLLPPNAYHTDNGEVLEEASELCSDKVIWIDLRQSLTGEESFYNTDHHWTTKGAYQAYGKLAMDMIGKTTEPEGEPITVSENFYGTSWSASGAIWVLPDSINTWIPENSFEVTGYKTGMPEISQLYVEEYLLEKDQYAMFLGGNQPLCIIRNEVADGKLLVIRDSFADSLVPFLAQDFGEVHLIDLRYFRESVSSYIDKNEIDSVLVLYSNTDFVSDENLFLMMH